MQTRAPTGRRGQGPQDRAARPAASPPASRRLAAGAAASAARAIAEHLLAAEPVRRAATVAAYVSVGTEPGTGPLLEQLAARGSRVILPVVLPDLDLDWAVYDGRLVAGRRGLLEPAGPRLGLDAIATADVVLTPGLAVDRGRAAAGQGGGCYDRALARVPVGTFTVHAALRRRVAGRGAGRRHDRPVTAVAQPRGVSRHSAGSRTRVSSVASCTASGVLGHGRSSPRAHDSAWSV